MAFNHSNGILNLKKTILGILLSLSILFGTAFPSPAQSLTFLGTFDPPTTGDVPYGSLVQGDDGAFYGTTWAGGNGNTGPYHDGYGGIFKVTSSGAITALHFFSGPEGCLPYCGLTKGADGNFYGVTGGGGVSYVDSANLGLGTVFKITPDGIYTLLHSFTGFDGYIPTGRLVQGSDGAFYGTTGGGGPSYIPGNLTNSENGTIFKITPNGVFTSLYAFNGTDGAAPACGLTLESSGNFVGATCFGGPTYTGVDSSGILTGSGTIFRVTPTGTLTTLHAFIGTDGGYPFKELVSGNDGFYYGTTVWGGATYSTSNSSIYLNGYGVVYRIGELGALTVLHSFNSVDGAWPYSSVTKAGDGSYYGTTLIGGTGGNPGQGGGGTLFSITPGGGFTNLYNFSFAPTDSSAPYGALTLVGNSTFYGTTTDGFGPGKFFEFSPQKIFTAITVSPSTFHVFAGTTKQFTAAALDQFGDPMSPQPVFTWSVSGGGTIDGTGLFTAGSSLGGPFSVTATSGAMSGTATITVDAAPVLTTISLSPPTASVISGASRQFTATAKDQNGDPMSPQPTFTWSVSGGGSIDSTGLFTAGSSLGGPFTITAMRGSVSGTASITVVGAPVLTSISVSPPTEAINNRASQQFTAIAKDQYGVPMASQPAITWSVSGGGTITNTGLFNADAVSSGPFTMTAASGGVVGAAVITVIYVPVVTSISVSPPTASVNGGASQQFTAVAKDQNGVLMAYQPAFTWSVSGGGTISDTGLFTADAVSSGPFTVTATSGGVNGDAVITVVYIPVLTSISISPPTASVNSGASQQFTAIAKDQNGVSMASQPAISWSVSGGGTISNTGLFTADIVSSGPFTVTAASGAIIGTTVVTDHLNSILTNIAITGGGDSVITGGSLQFAATGIDQSNNVMSPQPIFTWSVSGGGTVSSTGLFTAGYTPGGPFTITVGSGSVSWMVQVTVTPGPSIDFNGDGKPDLVLQNTGSRQVALWYMNGPSVLGGHFVSLTPSINWNVVCEGDFNGDGKPDLALQDSTTNKVALWYLNGPTLIGGAYISATPAANWKVVGSGDFNGDGKPDLVLQNTATNQVAVWYLNGTAVIGGGYVSATPPAGWRAAATGDFNSDGKPDLVLQNAATNQVAIWYLNGLTVTGGAFVSSTPPAGWNVFGAGDFNGDGKRDLVLQNTATSQIALWYLNGVSLVGGGYVSSTPAGWKVVGPR